MNQDVPPVVIQPDSCVISFDTLFQNSNLEPHLRSNINPPPTPNSLVSDDSDENNSLVSLLSDLVLEEKEMTLIFRDSSMMVFEYSEGEVKYYVQWKKGIVHLSPQKLFALRYSNNPQRLLTYLPSPCVVHASCNLCDYKETLRKALPTKFAVPVHCYYTCSSCTSGRKFLPLIKSDIIDFIFTLHN